MVEIKLTHSQLKSVQEYCKLNNIEDVNKFITKCYTEGFNIKKYGLLGNDSEKTGIVGEKQVEIEVIREIRVEVPVEVIKEVEVVKEIIREVEVIKEVIVEVPVPNIGKIRDENQINELLLKIQQLENQEPIIKEVIVEKEVIREVVVEKETTDNSLKPKLEALQNTVQKLKQDNIDKDKKIREYEKTIEDIQKFNDDKRAMFLKGSNLDDKLYK